MISMDEDGDWRIYCSSCMNEVYNSKEGFLEDGITQTGE